jgi:hypothetical protein
MTNRKTRIRNRTRGLDGLRIAVERNKLSARAEPLEDCTAVSAATERRIDVGAVCARSSLEVQCGDRLREEHGLMCGHIPRPLQREAFDARGRQRARLLNLCVPGLGVPEFEMATLPDESCVTFEKRELAQRG